MTHDDPHTAPVGFQTGLTSEERHALLHHARRTLERYLAAATVPDFGPVSGALARPGASFVTLTRRPSGELRGCRGEYRAQRPLVEAVQRMAIAAAVDDPRFPPVTLDELPTLHIEISVLSALRPIQPEEVVVGRHGLMLVKGRDAGLLLPQVAEEMGWSPEQFLDALCRKANLPAGAWRRQAQLLAFESEAWGE